MIKSKGYGAKYGFDIWLKLENADFFDALFSVTDNDVDVVDSDVDTPLYPGRQV